MSSSVLPRDWDQLTHRIIVVPLRTDDDRTLGRHRVLGTLTVAHASGKPLVVAWVRGRKRGAIQVLVGGVKTEPGVDDASLGFPPGARGRPQDKGEVEAVLRALTWERAELSLDAGCRVEESLADRLEEMFMLSGDPMGFVVSARPLPSSAVTGTVDTLSDEIARLEALRSGRGVHRRQLARAEHNLEYLDQSLGTGCWELEVWGGGPTAERARATAALLAGSADLAEVPLAVRPQGFAPPGQIAWVETLVTGPDSVAALARPPFRELPGVRVTPLPDFDQNVEDKIDVKLGSVLDGSGIPAAPFGVSLDSINRHVFVSGATGAGKSETVRSLLWSLNRLGIPWLVIEPAKAEYAALAPWLDPSSPLTVIRPGDPDAPPPMINPLEPSSITVKGVRHLFPLQTHLDMVKALFTAAFDPVEPFPQVLSAGLTGAYQGRGWNLVTGAASDPSLSPPQWPVLSDLVRESLSVIDGLGYAADVRNNVRGFIRVRVESLRSGTPGRFFEGGYPMDLEDLLGRPAVFEIEDLGDDRDKAFFIGSLIIRVVELLRLRQKFGLQKPGLGHVIVIEEAHRLLRKVAEENPSAHAVTMFANLLAEIRSYGEGVVVAEQIPSKVIADLVKNSAVKLMHRLPAEDDRATVGATMNLTKEQSAYVVALQPGAAVAHSAGMDRPVLVRIDKVGAQSQSGAGTAAPRLTLREGATADEKATPLTLGELETARDLVTPAVSLWSEFVVIACLTNDEIGTPSGYWFQALQAAVPRSARCALGLAVGEAVNRRLQLVRAWHDPLAFGDDVAVLMDAQLRSGRGLKRPKLKWAVGQFRFTMIRAALEDRPDGVDSMTPHPATAKWSAAGFDLPGPTWDDQIAQVDALSASQPRPFPHDIAGSPPVLVELAASLGFRGGTEHAKITRAIGSLGLEHRWLANRVRARSE